MVVVTVQTVSAFTVHGVSSPAVHEVHEAQGDMPVADHVAPATHAVVHLVSAVREQDFSTPRVPHVLAGAQALHPPGASSRPVEDHVPSGHIGASLQTVFAVTVQSEYTP